MCKVAQETQLIQTQSVSFQNHILNHYIITTLLKWDTYGSKKIKYTNDIVFVKLKDFWNTIFITIHCYSVNIL